MRPHWDTFRSEAHVPSSPDANSLAISWILKASLTHTNLVTFQTSNIVKSFVLVVPSLPVRLYEPTPVCVIRSRVITSMIPSQRIIWSISILSLKICPSVTLLACPSVRLFIRLSVRSVQSCVLYERFGIATHTGQASILCLWQSSGSSHSTFNK